MPQEDIITETTFNGPVAARGRGMTISWGWQETTTLGAVMIGTTARGICWLGFEKEGKRGRSEERMRAYWPTAEFVRDDVIIKDLSREIERRWSGQKAANDLSLDLQGTAFQMKVWRALLAIPFGKTLSYQDVARQIKAPKAARAVGGAAAANPVSLLVPCHRVIQSNGDINNYGWGNEVKKKLLSVEKVDNKLCN